MINIQSLVDSLELVLEIRDLKELGLTDEEIEGYVEMFWNELVSARAEQTSN